MAIVWDNKTYRNLQEQVYKNMKDIQDIQDGVTVLAEFGIKVVGQVPDVEDLPDPEEYEGDYGDAYIVGEEAPYDYYIFTRAFEGDETPQWFNIGQFPVPGPEGPQGEQGPIGITPSITNNASITTLLPSQSATISVTQSGTDANPVLTWSFGIPKGDTGLQGPQGQKGDKGDKGDTGDQGPRGEDGTTYIVLGQVDDAEDLPNPSLVSPRNGGYLVGTEAPYDLYVIVNDSEAQGGLAWFNAGGVTVGPRGPQGEQGPVGATPDISVTASGSAISGSATPTVTVTESGTTAAPSFAFSFGIPKTLFTFSSNQVSGGTDLKSIVIEGDAWNIAGGSAPQASDFTEGTGIVIDEDPVDNKVSIAVDTSTVALKSDLSSYVEASDLATVATTGDYDDLTNKPTIPDAVSGTNDGTNWTSLTIGNDTYALGTGSDIDIDNKTIVKNNSDELKTAIGGWFEEGVKAYLSFPYEFYDTRHNPNLISATSAFIGYGSSSNNTTPIWPNYQSSANQNGYAWAGASAKGLAGTYYHGYAYPSAGATNPDTGVEGIINQMVTDVNNSIPPHIKVTISGTPTGGSELTNWVFCDSYMNGGTLNTNVQWKDANEASPAGTGNYCSLWQGDNYVIGLSGYDFTSTLPTNANHKIKWDDASWSGVTPVVNIEIYEYEAYQAILNGAPDHDIYHQIDGRYIPIDGTSITLNSNNQLQGFSGDYDDLTDKPTIPDAVSGTNDGTNWTSLTIGNDTYGIGGGSAPSNMVTTDTEQNITGVKIFANTGNAVQFKQYTTDSISRLNVSPQLSGMTFQIGDGLSNQVQNLLVQKAYNKPWYIAMGNNEVDLGRSISLWRDLYLAGNLSNGTDTATVADIAALVAYAKTQGWIQ